MPEVIGPRSQPAAAVKDLATLESKGFWPRAENKHLTHETGSSIIIGVRKLLVMMVVLPASLLAGNVIINEVSVRGGGWVELKNTGSTPVNLKGWSISNSNGSDLIGDYTIQPGGYLVIATSRNVSADVYLEDGSVGSGLSSASDMLLLRNQKGQVVDQVNWGRARPSWKNYTSELWAQGPDLMKTGVISRIPDALDRDSPNDFREVAQGTPGSENMYTAGLDTPSWGKIKALFSPANK